MRNQPKYNFFKNTSYALRGLKDIFLNETSFRLEILILIILILTMIFIDISLQHKILIILSFFVVIIAEAINSAIERTVDLVTTEYNEMAGRAKDVGSTIVFLSIVFLCISISYVVFVEFIQV